MSTLNLIHSTSDDKYNTSGEERTCLNIEKNGDWLNYMNSFLFSFSVDMVHTHSSFQKKTLDRTGAASDVGQRHLPKEACLK